MGRVVFIACTNVGRAMIEAVLGNKALAGVELAGVVNLRPEAAIEKANYDSYIDLVKKYQLKIYYCENVNEKECVDFLTSCEPDIIIQSGWSQKFSREVLNIPRFGCIGEHPAPLPKGRGAACINWAIITGEKEWGNTFFRMETQYDTGEIYARDFFTIELYDDVKTVYDKVAASSVKIILEHLDAWANGTLNGAKQNDSLATHYKRRKPSDGELNFSENAMCVYNQIRGQTKPYPGAFFYADADGETEKIYVWRAALSEENIEGGIKVVCGDGKGIVLLRVQPEGKPEAWAADCLTNIKISQSE